MVGGSDAALENKLYERRNCGGRNPLAGLKHKINLALIIRRQYRSLIRRSAVSCHWALSAIAAVEKNKHEDEGT